MFNIFKKKEKLISQPETRPMTVLCIPGNWKDRDAIVRAIVENNSGEFIFAGMILLNLKTNAAFKLEIYAHDERMKESFRWAGMVNRVSEAFLDEVDKHKYVLYLSSETGDLESAKAIAEAGEAILKAGGTGVKVETTGKAFTKEHWTGLLQDFKESNLYQMFVLDSIRDAKGRVYTCGMHNLGLKDCMIINEEFQEAVDTISIFGYYQLIEKPEIRNNQTFSTAVDAPVFVITEKDNQPNKGDELFENPYGMWQLERKVNS